MDSFILTALNPERTCAIHLRGMTMQDMQLTSEETKHASELGTGRAGNRRLRWLIVCGFLFIVVLPYCAWSIMGERTTEVDIDSGRQRVRTEFLGHTITEKVVDWPFSAVVAKYDLAAGTPDFRFAWSSPVGLRKIMGDTGAVGKYGRVLADLQTTVRFATRHNRVILEEEHAARLLQFLRDADDSGLLAFTTQFINTKDMNHNGDGNSNGGAAILGNSSTD